jgi:SAM-dependent methyltransferase
MNDAYIFSDHADAAERQRLQMLEQAHDPRTVQLLQRAGLKAGQVCAEIGAGAGSIAGHMAQVAGPEGRAVAVDIDPRFLDSDLPGWLEVRQADVAAPSALEQGAYDVIHARFVLVHLADPVRAVAHVVKALKPGGALLLEEPDFRTAFSAAEDARVKASVDAVNRAICGLYRGMGKDPGFGIRLPGILRNATLNDLEVEVLAPLVAGGDRMAVMMGASVWHLRERLVQTGEANETDVDLYCAASADSGIWASYYGTVSVLGRKGT